VPERGDRATFALARSWGGVGSGSGGSGASIGEAGRLGMLPTPLAQPGACRPALVIARMKGEVGHRGLWGPRLTSWDSRYAYNSRSQEDHREST
jgi:hypothetical protein